MLSPDYTYKKKRKLADQSKSSLYLITVLKTIIMNYKISDFNTKDQLFKDYQEQSNSSSKKKALALFNDLYFYQEYKVIYLSALALRFIANTLSSLTLGVALWLALSPLLGSMPSLALGALACIVLEVLKNRAWNITTKKALKYKEHSRFLLATLLSLHVLSLFGSALGAWQMPGLLPIKKAPKIKLESIDSIKSAHSPQIALINEQIKSLSSKISSSTARATIKNLTEQKQELSRAQNLAIERAYAQNDTKRAKEKESAKKEQINRDKRIFRARLSCVSIAILFELIYIACSMFIAYYLFRLFVDTKLLEQELESAENDGVEHEHLTASAESDGERPHRVVIQAFKNSTASAESTNTSKIEYTKECALNECSKPFIHNVHNQKYCSKECRKRAHYESKKNQIVSK